MLLDLGWGSGDREKWTDCRHNLRRQNRQTLVVLEERQLQGQLSGRWLWFLERNIVKEQVQGEVKGSALKPGG